VSAQLSLLPDVARTERPWKLQRQTAREVYRQRRVDDRARQAAGVETREGQVLRLLAAHWNAMQTSPTALELLAWARARGERLFDCNSVRPRITALVEQGLVDKGTKRKCQVSGKVAWTWVVREQGSVKR
jgi:hypothetical protein